MPSYINTKNPGEKYVYLLNLYPGYAYSAQKKITNVPMTILMALASLILQAKFPFKKADVV